MSTETRRIRLCSIEFFDSPFRKLRSLTLNFAPRLTLIAGHNGVGKSTILGLVANTFGATGRDAPKSYFGDPFYANIERIIYLALREVEKAQETPGAAPIVVADVGGLIVKKRCSMTHRSEWKRARVVPRTVDRDEADPVGQDAKIPLPTIYLGIRRLAPIGEAEEKEVLHRRLDMHEADSQLMADFIRSVILGIQVTTDVTHLSIRGSKKRTAQLGYTVHDALAVSLGQDSLASIATALASFNRLKRELDDEYPGGLLVIDELDAGFHPQAIDRLMRVLKAQARRLDLQIVATSHSPRLIEACHPEGSGNPNAPDKVIYLLDTRKPRLAEDQSLAAILQDMAMRGDVDEAPASKPVLCVYLEDKQAEQFCNALFSSAKRAGFGRRHGVQIKLIALGIGGSQLIALPDKDTLFEERVLIVDADTKIKKSAAQRGNAVKLPCPQGASGTDRSPENIIRLFLHAMAEAVEGPLHQAMLGLKTSNPSSDKILSTFFSDDAGSAQRDSTKAWWDVHWTTLDRWDVIGAWASCHQTAVGDFVSALEHCLEATAVKVKKSSLAKSGSTR